MTRRPTPRLLVAAGTSLVIVMSAILATSGSAVPTGSSCEVAPTAPSRCPTIVQRSPDTPTYERAVVADAARHRLYVIGTDEAGWESFRAIDTRNSTVVTQVNYRATKFADDSAAGVNSVDAQLTPDGRTLVASGYVYHQGVVYPAVIAVATATGMRRWSWVGTGGGYAGTVVIDPSRKRAYVAGSVVESGDNADDAMIRGFDLATGRPLWAAYVGHNDGIDTFFKGMKLVAGRLVAIGTAWGQRHGSREDSDQLIATLDPRTGRWIKVRDLDDGDYEFGVAMAALPDRHSVVVTGAHTTQYTGDAPAVYGNDTETVAVDVRDLSVRWRQHQPGSGGLGVAVATAGNEVLVGYWGVELSPTDTTVGITGDDVWMGGRPGLQALDAHTGAELWHRDGIAPVSMANFYVNGLVVRQQTGYVVGGGQTADAQLSGVPEVPGSGYTRSSGDGWVEAFDVATGAERWQSDYNDDPNGMYATSFTNVVANADGVFVAGSMETRTVSAAGTINGTILRYDP